jgi:hypothetical protein
MNNKTKLILVFLLVLFLYFSVVFFLVYKDPRTFGNYTITNRHIKYFDFNYSAVNLSDNIDDFYDRSLEEINNLSKNITK